MTPGGFLLIVASMALDLPAAAARLVVSAVVLGAVFHLGTVTDIVVGLVAFGPYARGLLAVALPLPAGPGYRAALGARRPSAREAEQVAEVLALIPGARKPGALFVVDAPDENAWVLGTTLFLSRGLFDGPHLAPVVGHEAGHLWRGDGQVALAAWWLPVRSLAWVGRRLLGRPPDGPGGSGRALPGAGRALPGAGGPGGTGATPLGPGPGRGPVGWMVRLPALALGGVAMVLAGGVVPQLLRPAWAAYRRASEYWADGFAADAGLGSALTEALADWQVLDVATPWWWGRSHPYVEQRLDRLRTRA